jgi:hypothetical protein
MPIKGLWLTLSKGTISKGKAGAGSTNPDKERINNARGSIFFFM